MKPYRALATLIQAELGDIEHSVERAEQLLNKAERQNDDDYFDGIALNIHGFYSGTERVFQEIARTIDGFLPSGREWHRELLLQLSADMNGVRPAVIQRSTRLCLDEYRSFRHVVRNVYTFNLRPSRLTELVNGLRPCLETLQQELELFSEFLQQLHDEAESD